MKNLEIRILLGDKKTVIVVDNQDQLIENVKTKDVHSVTIYGDMPVINLGDTGGRLYFSHSGLKILLAPRDWDDREDAHGDKTFEFKVCAKFMGFMKSTYEPGLQDNFATTFGRPFINEDNRLSLNPESLLFKELGASGNSLQSEKDNRLGSIPRENRPSQTFGFWNSRVADVFIHRRCRITYRFPRRLERRCAILALTRFHLQRNSKLRYKKRTLFLRRHVWPVHRIIESDV